MPPIVTEILGWLPYVISAAAAAAAVLPAPADGSIWASVRKAIDFLALNFGNAKNQPK